MKSRYLGALLLSLVLALCNAFATPSPSFGQIQTRNSSKPSGMPADAQKAYSDRPADYGAGRPYSKSVGDAQRVDFERLSDADTVVVPKQGGEPVRGIEALWADLPVRCARRQLLARAFK